MHCIKLYAPLAMCLHNRALNVVEIVVFQVVFQKSFCCNFQLQMSLLFFCLVGFYCLIWGIWSYSDWKDILFFFDQNFLMICFKEMTLVFQSFNSTCWLAIISCFQIHLFSVSDRYCRAHNPQWKQPSWFYNNNECRWLEIKVVSELPCSIPSIFL